MLKLLRPIALFGLVALFLVPLAFAQEQKTAPAEEPKKAAGLDLAVLFKKLDSNGDGKLTSEEFKKIADLPEVQRKLTGTPRTLPENFDLEKFKEKIGPERFEKLKERFGGKIDVEKLKELLEKRKNKNP